MKLVIKPFGGVGNRMRVLHSALTLLREESVDLEIIWHKNETLNCSIHSLFEVPPQILVTERFESLPIKVLQKADREFQAKKYLYERSFYDQEIKELYQNNYNFRNLLQYQSVFIETCQWMIPANGTFASMEVVPSIRTAAYSYTSRFSENTIGLHIRRADHKKATDRSPLSKFIHMARHEINLIPFVNFFLATDCEDTEKTILHYFKDRVIVQENKSLERDTPEGIQAAFIDMLCLASTQKIYGSFYSSFSHIASLIGNIPRHVVDILETRDETEFEVQV